MQNTNSKTNTFLLIILVILAVIIIWMQWHDRKAEEGKNEYMQNQTMQNSQKNDYQPDEHKDNETSGLQKIISVYPQYPIFKCNYGGKIYYLSMHAVGGGSFLYTSQGDQIATFSTVSPQMPGDYTAEEKAISETCSTLVYKN